MNKSAMLLCAAMSIAVWSLPAGAQSRLKTCNDEWNAMKANNTVGDKKYADFRKECLARTAAAPAAAPGESEASPTVPPLATAPKTKTKTATPGAATPGGATPGAATPTASDAVFPTAVSPKYSSESGGRARMHTCRDQYNENKAGTGNGGLHWIQKGGGYYSECNKHLKEG